MNQNNKFIFPVFLIIFFLTVSFEYLNQSTISINFQTNSRNFQIVWSKNYRLKWSDFKGLPDKNSSFEAVTTSTLKTDVNLHNNQKIEYEIKAIFEKNKSWTKSDGIELLAHEQLHFDMAELVLRKMRKKLSKYKFIDVEDLNKVVNLYFKEAAKERSELGQKYDDETEHGINKEYQNKWKLLIASEMNLLEQYSSPIVTILR